MDKFNLKDMWGGWFVGNFEPSVKKESNFEVAIKEYKAGEIEKKHKHKVAYEITVIIKGRVIMNKREYEKNDIILINPGESTDFRVIEDTITCVVKSPSIRNDKFLID